MKKQTILCGTVSLQTSLAVVPTGLYLNNRLDKLNPSEDDVLLTFQDAWRKTQVLLVSKCRLNLNTALGSFIIRYAFGSDKDVKWLTDQWDAVCVNEGYMTANSKSKAYSLESVWLLNVKEFIREIWEHEQREKREREEALKQAALREKELLAKAKERERLLEQARKGIFEHKDIIILNH